jgi:hypothetical protein
MALMIHPRESVRVRILLFHSVYTIDELSYRSHIDLKDPPHIDRLLLLISLSFSA